MTLPGSLAPFVVQRDRDPLVGLQPVEELVGVVVARPGGGELAVLADGVAHVAEQARRTVLAGEPDRVALAFRVRGDALRGDREPDRVVVGPEELHQADGRRPGRPAQQDLVRGHGGGGRRGGRRRRRAGAGLRLVGAAGEDEREHDRHDRERGADEQRAAEAGGGLARGGGVRRASAASARRRRRTSRRRPPRASPSRRRRAAVARPARSASPSAARGGGRGLPVHARLVGACRERGDGVAAGDLAQRRGDLRGPAVRFRLGQQQRAGALGVRLRLLAEEPVRDLARPGRRGQVRGQRGEAAPGAGADRLFGHPEQVGQLAVGPSLAQDELHGGALIGRQPVERGGAACRHLGA